MTRRELQKKMNQILTRAHMPHAALDASVLLRHACGDISATDLLAHPEIRVPFWAGWYALALAHKRAHNTPIAYLTGRREFYGRSFFVNTSTLIPRPESECLIEAAITLPKPDLILDVGTGTGALGITLALEYQVPTFGIDSSKRACKLAEQNARHLQATHFTVHRGSYLLGLPKAFYEKYTQANRLFIVANLPYLSEVQWQACPKEVREFEPKSSLVSPGPDGLTDYHTLMQEVLHMIKENPQSPSNIDILIEIDPGQAATASQLMPWPHKIVKDLRGEERAVLWSRQVE